MVLAAVSTCIDRPAWFVFRATRAALVLRAANVDENALTPETELITKALHLWGYCKGWGGSVGLLCVSGKWPPSLSAGG